MVDFSDLELARQVLQAQPFAGVVGADIVEFGDNQATLRLAIDDRHRQQFGLVHGGVYSYLADNSITFAAGTALGPSILTAGFTIEYVNGVRNGILEARARVIQHSARRAVCTADIVAIDESGEEQLCALVQGTVLSTSSPGGKN